MKSRVKLSPYALTTTVALILVLLICCALALKEARSGFWVALGVLVVVLILGFTFGPTYIIANQDNILIKTNLRKHKINTSEIENVELYKPDSGAYRLCGSRGFFGYWGLFRDSQIGKYVAYYGKASDCFLLNLKNGKKYVLGCENPQNMTAYIKEHLSK